jgi:mevalonate pyrophosphate decarboxylase
MQAGCGLAESRAGASSIVVNVINQLAFALVAD